MEMEGTNLGRGNEEQREDILKQQRKSIRKHTEVCGVIGQR